MFPWTHAAFGYLLFVALVGVFIVLGYRQRIARVELLAVVVGTQLPDLVDKPLAWWLGVLPAGRSLAHSLFVAVPLALVVLSVAWYRGYPMAGVAFGVGYASHLVGDSYVALYYWRPAEFAFLFWPVLPPYPYEEAVSLADLLQAVTDTQSVVLPLAVLVGVGFLLQFLRAPWYPSRALRPVE
jgi:hypothetical protein